MVTISRPGSFTITAVTVLITVWSAAALLPTAGAESEPARPSSSDPAAALQEQPPVLVSTEWVAQHLDDPGVHLVHVAMHQMDPPGAFIPGAVPLDYHTIESSAGLAVEMPPVEQLVSAMSAAGISDDVHVVLYGGGAAHIAARAFVTLEYLGHRRVSVMDGGVEAWIEEGRPTSSRPAPAERASFTAEVDEEVVVDAAWILQRLDDDAVAVIDARPAEQYAGRSSRNLREGHIPGAGNIYYVELLQSEQMPRLRPRADIEALFAAAGATPGSTVISYCQIGMRASYNYLIARHLGYDVRLYDGSWQEWGADPSLPAETGGRR